MENVQYEFREELSMDEDDEYVEGFIINEEEHEDIESFEKKMMKLFIILICYFESDILKVTMENYGKCMNIREEDVMREDPSLNIERMVVREKD